MWVRLVRRTFADRPDWEVINDDVPIGKLYKVAVTIPLFRRGTIFNKLTGESRDVDCVFVIDQQGNPGMMVMDVLEIVDPIRDSGKVRETMDSSGDDGKTRGRTTLH